jgi:hypothetical protein
MGRSLGVWGAAVLRPYRVLAEWNIATAALAAKMIL